MDLNSHISILIPSRNRPSQLVETLDRIKSSSKLCTCPIIVYNDASSLSDDYQAIAKKFAYTQIIQGSQRCGQAKARNTLLRSSSTPFSLFLDDDVRPQEVEIIEDVISQFLNYKDIAIIVPYVRVDYSRYSDQRISESPRPSGNLNLFSGAAFFANRETILELGGFREFFVYGVEEPELSLRILGNHFRIVAEPSITFVHEHSPSARDEKEYYYLYSRNHLLMYGLNFPWSLGIIYGTLKSLAWSARKRNHRISRWQGLLHGFRDLIRYRHQHLSLGWHFAIRYIFQKL